MANQTRITKLLDRVAEMELRYDSLSRALGNLEAAISEFQSLAPDLRTLRDYMDSGQWQKDYEADEAGKIPPHVKRGVLSEDGLYDLLERADNFNMLK